jgi:sugar lactone lactonase YvrE
LKTRQSAIIAGTGQPGFSGDGGPAINAAFNQVFAVHLNPAGDKLYVTDLRNRRIRSLDLQSGVVTTIAGNGQEGVPADGAVAKDSPLVDPRATAADSKGNLYIVERGGNALRVLNKEGRIRTVIGADSRSLTPGLNGPKQLCIDRDDKVMIVDTENHLIRRYDPKTASISVIAGSGEKGTRLVLDDPLKTQLNRPHDVFEHSSGALYISDSSNHRVLRLSNWR